MKRIKKRIIQFLIGLSLLYLVLLIPDNSNSVPVIHTKGKPFSWNRDDQWKKLENNFKQVKLLSAYRSDSVLNVLKSELENKLASIQYQNILVNDSALFVMENKFFEVAAYIVNNQKSLIWYSDYYNRFRNFVKLQSQHWDMHTTVARDQVYTLLYGLRAAFEEVLLQVDGAGFPPAMLVKNEFTATPVAKIFGIEVHSGDILVSRGGAEVSALISRGNDYPGNFSHVALLYVEENTNKPFLIEAHIEKGVAVSSVEQYEKDKKLRFMVLRPRADLPAIIADPMLPQKAAKYIYDESKTRHIPYDFKMNFHDSTEMFCSEVASYAYRKYGLQFWKTGSTISTTGVVNWLHDFGVENFITQMPSDLEYDPQLAVIAEWRDKETLFKDHLDNAVMDALLEKADKGLTIEYDRWQLPVVRMIKGYCVIKNQLGYTGMIPEGMSATRALKNQTFVSMHKKGKLHTQKLADEFISQNQYKPPYWKLVEFAKKATVNL